ncbi:hypothetical protein [Pleurocapsa sp. PCC 7319]|uniref:hypothetical protein n=1 Tax=Pleurocapsa sp. PCC 7319 TaxID=118161 RepID=UPI000346ED79|nr:hypothetical protein [Pleurocapsa sp. PCC 7319]
MFSTTNIDRKIIKTCIASEQSMHPRIFCRRLFGLEDVRENGRPRYTEKEIVLLESEHGYREKCINLIAKVLKIKPNTVHRWGKGVEFDKIPPDKQQQYETYLGYADLLRLLAMGMVRENKNLLLDLVPSSKSIFLASESQNRFRQQKFYGKFFERHSSNYQNFALSSSRENYSSRYTV